MREEVAAVWFVCRVRIAMGSSIAACRVVIFLLAEVLRDQQENRVVFQAVQRRPAGGRASGAFGGGGLSAGVAPRMERMRSDDFCTRSAPGMPARESARAAPAYGEEEDCNEKPGRKGRSGGAIECIYLGTRKLSLPIVRR